MKHRRQIIVGHTFTGIQTGTCFKPRIMDPYVITCRFTAGDTCPGNSSDGSSLAFNKQNSAILKLFSKSKSKLRQTPQLKKLQ